ncbi:MAG: condensation domain-containing protein [Acidobacteria bacterium]|nr:condensation domain-containing protein [Acidobacteriota bacterium]
MHQATIEGYHLSPQQQRLWALQPRALVYRVQSAVAIAGRLQMHALKEAFARVVGRHEILRTSFRLLPGMDVPLQIVNEEVALDWHEVNIAGCGNAESREARARWMRSERERPFNCEQGRLLHACLLRESPESHVLILTLSALCADTRSAKNFIEEMWRHYAACLNDREVAGEVVQYADFTSWQNDLLKSDEEHAGREYWAAQSAFEVATASVPGRRDDVAAGYAPDVFTFELEASLAARLEEIARRLSAPPPVVLLAGWQSLLWRLTGESEIVVEAAFDGRKFEELRDPVGLFAKHLPLRCRFTEQSTFDDVVRQVGGAHAEAYEWQEFFSWEQRGVGATRGEGKSAAPVFGFEYEELASGECAGLSFAVAEQ